jgi:hypothetical protein
VSGSYLDQPAKPRKTKPTYPKELEDIDMGYALQNFLCETPAPSILCSNGVHVNLVNVFGGDYADSSVSSGRAHTYQLEKARYTYIFHPRSMNNLITFGSSDQVNGMVCSNTAYPPLLDGQRVQLLIDIGRPLRGVMKMRHLNQVCLSNHLLKKIVG